MSDEAAKEILSTWGNSHIKEWMKCKLIVGFRVALDFYKLFGCAGGVLSLSCWMWVGISTGHALIRVSLGNVFIFFHLSCGNCTCKCIGFDLTLQGVSVQVCAFLGCIRPQECVCEARAGLALQFACGIGKEESSTSRQYKECLKCWSCSSGVGMKLHFNCWGTHCAVKSSQ